MSPKIRLLELVSSLEKAGMERVVYDLCRTIDRERFHVTAACLVRAGEYAEPLARQGIEVIVLDKHEGKDLVLPLRFARLLARHRVQVLHVHNSWSLFGGMAAAVLARVPVRVYTEHGRAWPDRPRTMRMDRALLRLAHAVTAVSEATAENLSRYLHVRPDKITVIHNGVTDLAAEPRTPPADLFPAPDVPTIGFLGRLEPVKGADVLVEAMSRLVARRPGVRLLLCGFGSQEEALRDRVRRLGLAGHVAFAGWRFDAPDILAGLDLLTLPSRSEGLPVVALEAMSLSVPVVAARVGGVPEVIEDGVSGWLVPPEDPAALADALDRALADPDARARVAANGRRTFEERFSLERMVRAYEELLARLVVARLG